MSQSIEDVVRQFFPAPGQRFFEVARDSAVVPVVAVNLARSTRSFSTGQLLFAYDVYWGMNERAKVVGRYRGRHRFVRGVCPITALVDARPKLVHEPAAIRAMTGLYIDGGVFVRLLDVPARYRTFLEFQSDVLDPGSGPADLQV